MLYYTVIPCPLNKRLILHHNNDIEKMIIGLGNTNGLIKSSIILLPIYEKKISKFFIYEIFINLHGIFCCLLRNRKDNAMYKRVDKNEIQKINCIMI